MSCCCFFDFNLPNLSKNKYFSVCVRGVCVSFSHVHVCFQVTAKMVANAWYILAELLLNKLEEYGHRRLGHGSQAVLLKGPVLSHSIELTTALKK